MNPLIMISILTSVFFGIVAIILSLKNDRSKKSQIEEKRSIPDEKTHDEFLHLMVHELRAPLTSIKDSSELLLTSRASLKEEEQEQFARIINRQSKVLLEQVASILDTAKFESGNFTLYKKSENIADLIHEKIKVFEPQAEKKKITISSHIEGPIPPLYIDGLRIGQVINNLLSNSIKFTPEEGRISVEARVNGPLAEISISDSGMGIPKEQLPILFTKFYQVKTIDRHEEKDGSGLGLYIVKKIIDAHNGTISVESNEGKGTTMRFSLQIQAPHEEAHPTSPTPTAQYTIPN